jgi:hypothetical protein
MRRKVIQDFANVFCQRVVDLPSGYDLASFAHYGSGKYALNILTGECSHNGIPILKLQTCDVYDEWLRTQLERHGVEQNKICEARLDIEVDVRNVISDPPTDTDSPTPICFLIVTARSEPMKEHT